MACSSRCAARRAPHLRGLKVVNRELLHIGWVGEAAIAKTLQARHEPLADEGVEGLAGLPEVDHAPAALDRTGRVHDHPLGRVRVYLHHLVSCVVVLLRSSAEPEPYADSHCNPSS